MIEINHDPAQDTGYHIKDILGLQYTLVVELIEHVLEWHSLFLWQVHAQLQDCLQIVGPHQL